jgi:hypothetical protein
MLVSIKISTPAVSNPGFPFATVYNWSGEAAGLNGLINSANELVSVAAQFAMWFQDSCRR